MKNTIQKSILGNFRPDFDLLSFLPGLEAAADKNTKWVDGATIPKLGIASFGWVAMAAVEQYAKGRKLNPGTAEVLRLSAFLCYISDSTVAAHHLGYIDALNALKRAKPDLDEWLNEKFLLLDDKYQEAWRNSARAAVGVLKNIRDQNLRKGKRGNPGRTFGPHASPEAIILDLLDSEAIAAASNRVKFSDRNY